MRDVACIWDDSKEPDQVTVPIRYRRLCGRSGSMRLVCLCALRKEVEVTSAVDRCTASFGAVRLTSSIGSRGQGLFIQGRIFQLGKSAALAIGFESYGRSLVIRSIAPASSHVT